MALQKSKSSPFKKIKKIAAQNRTLLQITTQAILLFLSLRSVKMAKIWPISLKDAPESLMSKEPLELLKMTRRLHLIV